MDKMIKEKKETEMQADAMHRRKFLALIGGTASALGVLAACSKDSNSGSSNGGINLGTDDTGVLNYAYALEQLEAAFYTQVIMTLYSGATATEKAYLTDIRDHEIAHREFFKNLLGAKAIPDLKVNFSTIDFSKRESVLATAQAFEDLGVSAYNGAGQLLKDGNNLLLAGKIVSVEARHAAAIRDLVSDGSFADSTIIDMNGLDKARTPGEVLGIASAYLTSKLDASGLPTN